VRARALIRAAPWMVRSGRDPVRRGERSPGARQQQAREAPDDDEATRHAEVVEAEVVVALEPGDV
jgi:hypothetical protein